MFEIQTLDGQKKKYVGEPTFKKTFQEGKITKIFQPKLRFNSLQNVLIKAWCVDFTF